LFAKVDIFIFTSKSFGNYFKISPSKAPAAKETGVANIELLLFLPFYLDISYFFITFVPKL
jgi:hypothetical protein